MPPILEYVSYEIKGDYSRSQGTIQHAGRNEAKFVILRKVLHIFLLSLASMLHSRRKCEFVFTGF